jgi:hypothetical protein
MSELQPTSNLIEELSSEDQELLSGGHYGGGYGYGYGYPPYYGGYYGRPYHRHHHRHHGHHGHRRPYYY